MEQTSEKSWLDGALLDAHSRNDQASLIELYEQAGLLQEKLGDKDSACFYFTHAYVFALEQGAEKAALLKDRLVHHGRDRH